MLVTQSKITLESGFIAQPEGTYPTPVRPQITPATRGQRNQSKIVLDKPRAGQGSEQERMLQSSLLMGCFLGNLIIHLQRYSQKTINRQLCQLV